MFNEDTVLIIDEDSAARYNLKEVLWKFKCMAYESANTDEAITFIVTKKPGKIFISLDTVKATNYSLLHKIRELHDCSLIVYSNHISKNELMNCINASVNDVLLDPCSQLERLRSIVAPPLS